MSGSSTLLKPPALPQPPPAPRRHGLLVALIAAAAVLVLTIPVAYLVLRGPSPRMIGTNPAAPPSSASPSVTPVGPAPDGRITLAELRNATLDVPVWPADSLSCLSGRQTFVNGEVLSPPDEIYYFERHMIIGYLAEGPAYGDVDGDGAQETVVLIGCYVQGGGGQVVAFDRDTAGQIVTKGTVIAITGEIRNIDQRTIRVLPDGTVEVSVGDYQNCCGANAPIQWQTRGYGWIGDRFHQVSGPTGFPVNPGITDTAVTAGPLVFGPAVDGVRHGTVAVTVTYVAGGSPDHLSIFFLMTPDIARDGSGWPPVSVRVGFTVVDVPTPARGGHVTATFAFRRTADPRPDSHLSVMVRGISALDTGDPQAVDWLTEWDASDNWASVQLSATA